MSQTILSKNAPIGWNLRGENDAGNVMTKHTLEKRECKSGATNWDAVRVAALAGARKVNGLSMSDYEECASEAVEKTLTAKNVANICAYARQTARHLALKLIGRRRSEVEAFRLSVDSATGKPFGNRRGSGGTRSRLPLLARAEVRTKQDELRGVRGEMCRRVMYFVEHRHIFKDSEKEEQTYRTLLSCNLRPLLATLTSLGAEPEKGEFVEKLVSYRKIYFSAPNSIRNTRGRRRRTFEEYVNRPGGHCGLSVSGQEVPILTQYDRSPDGWKQFVTRRIVDKAIILCGLGKAYDYLDAMDAKVQSRLRSQTVQYLRRVLDGQEHLENWRNPVFKASSRESARR